MQNLMNSKWYIVIFYYLGYWRIFRFKFHNFPLTSNPELNIRVLHMYNILVFVYSIHLLMFQIHGHLRAKHLFLFIVWFVCLLPGYFGFQKNPTEYVFMCWHHNQNWVLCDWPRILLFLISVFTIIFHSILFWYYKLY